MCISLRQVIREFIILQVLPTETGEPVVPTPSRSIISYNRLVLRGGAAVGGQSLQHVWDFAEDCAFNPEMGENEQCILGCERAEPFFKIDLSSIPHRISATSGGSSISAGVPFMSAFKYAAL